MHPLDDKRSFMKLSHLHSPSTGIAWSHYISYTPRFRNLDKFYHSLVQQPYPLQVDEQGLSFFFPEVGLQFLALNSAWEIDEFFKDRSSINDSA